MNLWGVRDGCIFPASAHCQKKLGRVLETLALGANEAEARLLRTTFGVQELQ